MSRLLWVGVGAAGGIYAYRRGQRAWNTAKDRGVAGNMTVAAATASTLLAQMRTLMVEPQSAAGPGPSADRGAVILTRSNRNRHADTMA